MATLIDLTILADQCFAFYEGVLVRPEGAESFGQFAFGPPLGWRIGHKPIGNNTPKLAAFIFEGTERFVVEGDLLDVLSGILSRAIESIYSLDREPRFMANPRFRLVGAGTIEFVIDHPVKDLGLWSTHLPDCHMDWAPRIREVCEAGIQKMAPKGDTE
jgi:hypothetical protein